MDVPGHFLSRMTHLLGNNIGISKAQRRKKLGLVRGPSYPAAGRRNNSTDLKARQGRVCGRRGSGYAWPQQRES